MKSFYTSICMFALSLYGVSLFGQKTMSGEHLDGTRYMEYTRSQKIDKEVLHSVLLSLRSYALTKEDKVLEETVNTTLGEKWHYVGEEHLQQHNETGVAGKILVGARYKIDPINAVFYENLVMIAFIGEKGSYYYYLDPDVPNEVSSSYFFPKSESGSEVGGFIVDDEWQSVDSDLDEEKSKKVN